MAEATMFLIWELGSAVNALLQSYPQSRMTHHLQSAKFPLKYVVGCQSDAASTGNT